MDNQLNVRRPAPRARDDAARRRLRAPDDARPPFRIRARRIRGETPLGSPGVLLLMVLALLLPVPVGGQLGSSQVPSDDDSTRLASFPLTAVSHYAPVYPGRGVFRLHARPRRGVGARPVARGHFRARARRVQGLRRRGDGGRARPSRRRLPRLANSTVKMRSYAYNRTVHTWVNSTFNATTNVTTDETITEILEEYAYDGATRGWVTASNETGRLALGRRLVWYRWRRQRHDGRGARDQRRGPTLERHLSLAVTRSNVSFGCPGATSPLGCVSPESTVERPAPSTAAAADDDAFGEGIRRARERETRGRRIRGDRGHDREQEIRGGPSRGHDDGGVRGQADGDGGGSRDWKVSVGFRARKGGRLRDGRDILGRGASHDARVSRAASPRARLGLCRVPRRG